MVSECVNLTLPIVCCCQLSLATVDHCHFFLMIIGSGVPHQVRPNLEGFEVQNPITCPHVSFCDSARRVLLMRQSSELRHNTTV